MVHLTSADHAERVPRRDLARGLPGRPRHRRQRAVRLAGPAWRRRAAARVPGGAITAAMPVTRFAARANRAFLGRAVRYLATQAGITQFLDIGTGIPTAGNTHEVAQAAAPHSRIVYVDHDPIVLAHARALMASHPAGATAFIEADLREPGRTLASPELRATLDLGRPVAGCASGGGLPGGVAPPVGREGLHYWKEGRCHGNFGGRLHRLHGGGARHWHHGVGDGARPAPGRAAGRRVGPVSGRDRPAG